MNWALEKYKCDVKNADEHRQKAQKRNGKNKSENKKEENKIDLKIFSRL